MATLLATLAVIELKLSTGAVLPLRRHVSTKSGNTYHATLSLKANGDRYYNFKFGVNVEADVIGGSLPEWIELPDGTRLTLVRDVNSSGNTRHAYRGKVTIEGQERQLMVKFAALADGGFNVNGCINGVGGNTGGASKRASSL